MYCLDLFSNAMLFIICWNINNKEKERFQTMVCKITCELIILNSFKIYMWTKKLKIVNCVSLNSAFKFYAIYNFLKYTCEDRSNSEDLKF